VEKTDAQARKVRKAGGRAGKVDKADGLVGHAHWEVRQDMQESHRRQGKAQPMQSELGR
jgi:hypothetical protein